MEYRKERLPNGLRVVAEEIPYVRSVSIGVWVGCGSRNETEVNNGISHFLEHILFKGTEKRTARELAEAVDSVGGQINAYTAKEYTCFYCRVLDEHFELAVDVLSDMLLRSLFREEDVEKEKGVILEEIKMYEDTPDELVHDLFAQSIWERHPLGKTILGTTEAVGALGRDQLVNYWREHYTPDNMVISVAGNVKYDHIVDTLSRAFGHMTGERALAHQSPPEASSRVVVREKDTEQVHLCIGTRGVAQDNDDIYALYLLNSILGGGTSSRLFQQIREDRGLAYSVYSYQSAYRDAGLFTVYAGVSPRYVDEVIGLIMSEFEKLRSSGVEESELDRARKQVKGNLMLSLESTSNRMSRLGKSELTLGRVVTPEEVTGKIQTVTLEDLLRLARELLVSGSMTLTAIGPIKGDLQLPRFTG